MFVNKFYSNKYLLINSSNKFSKKFIVNGNLKLISILLQH